MLRYHKIGAYKLFNLTNEKIMMSQDIVIDENSTWDWNFGDTVDKPLKSNGFDKEIDKVEEMADIPREVDVEEVVHIIDTIEVKERVASIS